MRSRELSELALSTAAEVCILGLEGHLPVCAGAPPGPLTSFAGLR